MNEQREQDDDRDDPGEGLHVPGADEGRPGQGDGDEHAEQHLDAERGGEDLTVAQRAHSRHQQEAQAQRDGDDVVDDVDAILERRRGLQSARHEREEHGIGRGADGASDANAAAGLACDLAWQLEARRGLGAECGLHSARQEPLHAAIPFDRSAAGAVGRVRSRTVTGRPCAGGEYTAPLPIRTDLAVPFHGRCEASCPRPALPTLPIPATPATPAR